MANFGRSVKGWLRFAKRSSELTPQRDRAMANYDKALLSKQTARDLERLEEYLVNLCRRGMTVDRALNVTLDVLEARVRIRLGVARRSIVSIADVHQAEEDAEGAAESAETAFVHDPDSLSKAMVFLDRDSAFMTARAPLVDRARHRVAEG